MHRAMVIALALIWVTLSSATISPAPPPPKQAPVGVKPALWKLSDPDTAIYLFGTIHILPDDFEWRTPPIEAAIAESSTLVLEVNDLHDASANQSRFLRLAISPGLPPITERVPEDRRARLKLMVDKAGSSVEALSQFESWAVALSLASAAMNDLDAKPENGVDRQLSRQFRASRKPVLGLETSLQQLSFFDRLPESAQRVFLTSLIDEQGDVDQMVREMVEAWATGDEEKIALTFDDELALSPELTEALLRQRNRNWMAWLENRLRKPGTIFVAVGAGHLSGRDSVQAMLSAKGLKVERIQ